jgi:hypothetical protein
MEIMEKMRPHGGLIVPHKTLTVDAQSGCHTMEILVEDLPYPPPFIHLFTLTHPDIIRVQPEPNHTPPRIIVIGKPHAINMAVTARVLLAVLTAVMEMIIQMGTALPKTAGQNTYQVVGLSRQLDIIIEQNHLLHSLVRKLTPSTLPATENLSRGRLLTRIKRSSAGNNEASSSTHWSTSPVTPHYTAHTTPDQPLIIPDDVVSSTENSDTDGEDVTADKRRRLTAPVPHPDID